MDPTRHCLTQGLEQTKISRVSENPFQSYIFLYLLWKEMSGQGLTSALFPPVLLSDQPPQLFGGMEWKDESSPTYLQPHIFAAPVGHMDVTDITKHPFPWTINSL